MEEQEFIEKISEALYNMEGDLIVDFTRTFEEEMVLTKDIGTVVYLSNGDVFHVTVQKVMG